MRSFFRSLFIIASLSACILYALAVGAGTGPTGQARSKSVLGPSVARAEQSLTWCEEKHDGDDCLPPPCVKGKDTRVLVYFRSEKCAACKAMETGVFTDPEVMRRLAKYQLVRIDIEANRELADGAQVHAAPTVDASVDCVFLRVIGLPSQDPKANVAMFLRFLDAAEAPKK